MNKVIYTGCSLALAALLLTGCSRGSRTQSGAGVSPGGTGNTSADTAINTKAQAALSADPALKGERISVRTRGGQVYLSGKVKSIAEHDQAEKDVVQVISGYSKLNAGVVNNIVVKSEVAQAGEATAAAAGTSKKR